MASQIILYYREGAEVSHKDAACKKYIELLNELGLPTGLFPLDDIEEFGYNRAAGFIWLIQRTSKHHTFEQMKRVVSYAPEVTAFVEARKMKKMTGVKTKKHLRWLPVVEMYIDDPSSEKVTFKTGHGLSDIFPVLGLQYVDFRRFLALPL